VPGEERLYFNLGRVPRVSLARPPDPPPIGARTRLVPVVARVDAGRSRPGRYCFGCKFFACTSIRLERRAMGGTSHESLAPHCLDEDDDEDDDDDDKCAYLLTARSANPFSSRPEAPEDRIGRRYRSRYRRLAMIIIATFTKRRRRKASRAGSRTWDHAGLESGTILRCFPLHSSDHPS